MEATSNYSNPIVNDDKIEEKLAYYRKMEKGANVTYVRTGKLSDRLIATRYAAKVEVLEELLK